jgi:GNAT superfamily N-acetyltransferase
MANAKIDIVGQNDLPVVAEIYNQMFRPTKDVAFFRRRFMGRYNPLILIATLDERPVGFFCGFELKPSTLFEWLYGVLPEFRQAGVASQLAEAAHSWAAEHDYSLVRFECQNQHRPMLQMAITLGYDIVGLRWDADRNANLVIFEKVVGPGDGAGGD